jgi:hypothetical protein
VAKTILTRRLWYVDALDTVSVDQSFLQTDGRSLVVLGEAGMGKSTLLEQLKLLPGYAFCTARRLINAASPVTVLGEATTLVIDALDEVAAHRDGDAVDFILQKLNLIGNPRFILSCRVADWRSATALQGIKDLYDEAPVELHLDPLERADAHKFLAETLGGERADETLAHLEDRGLSGLWANPQTLILVETVARQGLLPSSKGDLFADATRLMLREHREEKAATPLAEMPEADVLDAAGAAFATLILAGKAALSRRSQTDEADIAMRDAASLPGAARVGDIPRFASLHGEGAGTLRLRPPGDRRVPRGALACEQCGHAPQTPQASPALHTSIPRAGQPARHPCLARLARSVARHRCDRNRSYGRYRIRRRRSPDTG